MEAVLAMAAFMKDFRPTQVFGGQQAGAPRVLHPVWMSGLVGEAVRRCCQGCAVNHLRIEHIAEGFEGDSLHARVEAEGSSSPDRTGTIRFRVVNGKRKVLATAVAEVIPAVNVTEGRQTER
jgi:hypothetical protein